MPPIKLTTEQFGEYDADGNMIKRPTQDIAGGDLPGGALHPTVKHLRANGRLYFVTIPTGKDHPDNVYELPVNTPTPKTKD